MMKTVKKTLRTLDAVKIEITGGNSVIPPLRIRLAMSI